MNGAEQKHSVSTVYLVARQRNRDEEEVTAATPVPTAKSRVLATRVEHRRELAQTLHVTGQNVQVGWQRPSTGALEIIGWAAGGEQWAGGTLEFNPSGVKNSLLAVPVGAVQASAVPCRWPCSRVLGAPYPNWQLQGLVGRSFSLPGLLAAPPRTISCCASSQATGTIQFIIGARHEHRRCHVLLASLVMIDWYIANRCTRR